MLGSKTGRKTDKVVRALRVLEVVKERNLNVFGSKNRATSQRSGQRCDIPESLNFNVVTFGPK